MLAFAFAMPLANNMEAIWAVSGALGKLYTRVNNILIYAYIKKYIIVTIDKKSVVSLYCKWVLPRN